MKELNSPSEGLSSGMGAKRRSVASRPAANLELFEDNTFSSPCPLNVSTSADDVSRQSLQADSYVEEGHDAESGLCRNSMADNRALMARTCGSCSPPEGHTCTCSFAPHSCRCSTSSHGHFRRYLINAVHIDSVIPVFWLPPASERRLLHTGTPFVPDSASRCMY
jgi:hypothetical protein